MESKIDEELLKQIVLAIETDDKSQIKKGLSNDLSNPDSIASQNSNSSSNPNSNPNQLEKLKKIVHLGTESSKNAANASNRKKENLIELVDAATGDQTIDLDSVAKV